MTINICSVFCSQSEKNELLTTFFSKIHLKCKLEKSVLLFFCILWIDIAKSDRCIQIIEKRKDDDSLSIVFISRDPCDALY